MKIGGFYITRNPFQIRGVLFGKYKILEETNKYILLKVYGQMYWSGFQGARYGEPNYTIIRKFMELGNECGEAIKYFNYNRKSKKEITLEMYKYWKEINK